MLGPAALAFLIYGSPHEDREMPLRILQVQAFGNGYCIQHKTCNSHSYLKKYAACSLFIIPLSVFALVFCDLATIWGAPNTSGVRHLQFTDYLCVLPYVSYEGQWHTLTYPSSKLNFIKS